MRQMKGSEMSYNLIEKILLSLSEYLSKWKDYARMPCVITYNKVIQSILSCDTCLEYSNRVQKLATPIIYLNAKIAHNTGVKLKMVKITQHPEGKMNILLDMQEVRNFQNSDPVCQSINKYIESPTNSSFSRLPKFLGDRISLVTTITNCHGIFKDCSYQFIVVDNAPELVSNEMFEYLISHNCLLIISPKYHSQSNGKEERANQTLRRLIEKFLDQNYSMCASIKKATNAMTIDKIRQYYCEEEETSFVPNFYKKIPVPHYIYFKRKGKLDRKFTLGLCIDEVGNRIYHIETDKDSFFVSKDFCHTGIPSSKQIEEIRKYDLNEYKLDDTFFINGKWDNKGMLVNFSDSKNAHDENEARFDLADNTLMWDNDELTLQMNSENNKSSCDESNFNFNTGSDENSDIQKKFTK
uniref:Integrase catalytic domain-containing protein n=1 Tax=Strongyloides venezuelensis TaxID=75913 RepID=A0A0K0FN81_STRVS